MASSDAGTTDELDAVASELLPRLVAVFAAVAGVQAYLAPPHGDGRASGGDAVPHVSPADVAAAAAAAAAGGAGVGDASDDDVDVPPHLAAQLLHGASAAAGEGAPHYAFAAWAAATAATSGVVPHLPLHPAFPRVPYVRELAQRVSALAGARDDVAAVDSVLQRGPVAMVGFVDDARPLEALRRAAPLICAEVAAFTAVPADDGPTLQHAAGRLLRVLGARGITALLGMRCTAASAAALPPPPDVLYAGLSALHTEVAAGRRPAHDDAGGGGGGGGGDRVGDGGDDSVTAAATSTGPGARRSPPKAPPPPSTLTVGARAAAKHCHRGAEGWWGVASGTVAARNAAAEALFSRLLGGAVWLNVHMVPHADAIFELRVGEGYGARWTAATGAFRGFLEPPMADGHSKGWRH